eukprot:sb/3470241/
MTLGAHTYINSAHHIFAPRIHITNHHNDIISSPHLSEPTETSKQLIRNRYLGHVTGYQPIRDQYFLIRSVPGTHTHTLIRRSHGIRIKQHTHTHTMEILHCLRACTCRTFQRILNDQHKLNSYLILSPYLSLSLYLYLTLFCPYCVPYSFLVWFYRIDRFIFKDSRHFRWTQHVVVIVEPLMFFFVTRICLPAVLEILVPDWLITSHVT